METRRERHSRMAFNPLAVELPRKLDFRRPDDLDTMASQPIYKPSVTRTHSLRASVLRCGGGSEEIGAVRLAANLGTATAARQHGDVTRVSEQRWSWTRLKNSPGGTLNSIRRGSQVGDEHRGVAQARGRHPGVDPVGRSARDEARAKDES
ncbi:hypothetical protein HPB52_000755 [Rhipicephalus sanguineus]|uniref:Uncharacterized protein n=1 Tax=Rhipicephalus sanguineus TaxID=34632 RepID=A0A9D4SPG5_RHISA|nr:hypothetical protein HPB52_000755 [Rhipicephalus sanguineus]